MSITTLANRQYPLAAKVSIAYTDITGYATAAATQTFDIFNLPAGALVTKVLYKVVTAFVDDASETQLMDLGTTEGGVADNPDAFTDTEFDIDGAAGTGVNVAGTEVGLGLQYTTPVTITATFTASSGSAALTAGEVLIYIEYIINTRSNENQD
jgi:hypothetical protein